MKVKFKKLIPKAQAPKFAHKGDAGADFGYPQIRGHHRNGFPFHG